MFVPNFSSLAGLEVAEKFLWGVGGVGGWGGLHSHFHVKPNRCVVLCWGWGFDNYILKLQLLNLFHHAFWRWFYEWRPYILPQILKDWNLFKRIKVKWNRALLSPRGGLISRHGILIKSSASVDIRGKSFRKNIVIFSESVSLTQYVVLSVCLLLDIVAGRHSDYCPRGAIFFAKFHENQWLLYQILCSCGG